MRTALKSTNYGDLVKDINTETKKLYQLLNLNEEYQKISLDQMMSDLTNTVDDFIKAAEDWDRYFDDEGKVFRF